MVPQDQVAGSSAQGDSLELPSGALLDDDEDGWTEIFGPGGEVDRFRELSDPGTSQKHCEGMECLNSDASTPSVPPGSDLPQPRKARRPPVSNDLPKPRRPDRRPAPRKSRNKPSIENPASQDPIPYHPQNLQPICGNQCTSHANCLPGCYCRAVSPYVYGFAWNGYPIFQALCVPFGSGNPGERDPGGSGGMSGVGYPGRSGAMYVAGWTQRYRRDK
ncbi:MAG: hypothetical protein M1824_004279 [Vezdaea acicularis]|nr:MAG: hypothetical protein M1824_004279 [Vezdaea acicularis]